MLIRAARFRPGPARYTEPSARPARHRAVADDHAARFGIWTYGFDAAAEPFGYHPPLWILELAR